MGFIKGTTWVVVTLIFFSSNLMLIKIVSHGIIGVFYMGIIGVYYMGCISPLILHYSLQNRDPSIALLHLSLSL
jgi:hypothetical protein